MGAGALRRKYAQQTQDKADTNSQWRKPRSKAEIKKAKKSGVIPDGISLTKAPSPRRASLGDDEAGARDLADAIDKIWSKILLEEARAPSAKKEPWISVEELQDNLELKAQKLDQAQQMLRASNGRYQSAQLEYNSLIQAASGRGTPGVENKWEVGDMAIRKGGVVYVDSVYREEGTFFFEVRPWNSSDVVGTEALNLIAPTLDDADKLREAVKTLEHSNEEMTNAESAAMKADDELDSVHERLREALHLPKDRMVGMPDIDLMKKWVGTLEADKEKPEPIPYPEVHGVRERAGVGNLGSRIDERRSSSKPKANEPLPPDKFSYPASEKSPRVPEDPSKAKAYINKSGDGPAGFPSIKKMKDVQEEEIRRAEKVAAAAAAYPKAHVQREEVRERAKEPAPPPPREPSKESAKEEQWRRVVSDGQTYYANMSTNETAWELPPNARCDEDESHAPQPSRNTQTNEDDDPFADLRRHAQEQEEHARQWNAWYAQYNQFINEEKQRQARQNYGEQQHHDQYGKPEQDGQRHTSKAPKTQVTMPEINKEFENRATFALKTGIQEEMNLMLKKPHAERKKALRTLQLQWHPDKNPDKAEIAKVIFQFIEESKEWFLAE
eukprot:GEMP01025423.1.p1 GENE.GEMP01025423.1~~GEMP01025423.1.p1  ORF type:complete len:612 (+),score=162.96 GEMP01025423.1:91-1926(+)